MTEAVRAALYAPPRDDERPISDEELAEALGPGAELLALPAEEGEAPADWARRALAAGANLLVAAGGDGSVAGVAELAIGHSDVTLGIVPCGTSNSIASHFGIDSRQQALDALGGGRVRSIDTALCNGKPMLLMATLGVHAEAVLDADPRAKSWLGVLAYAYEELSRVVDHELIEAEVSVDGHVFALEASAITVANLGPARSPLVHGAGGPIEDDGLLDLTAVHYGSLSEGLLTMLHLARCGREGSAAEAPNVLGLRGRELRVRTRTPRRLMVDGEPRGEGDLLVQVVPKSLRLLVPTE